VLMPIERHNPDSQKNVAKPVATPKLSPPAVKTASPTDTRPRRTQPN